MGRAKITGLDNKIRTMGNPNKKGWKNTVEQVKISGSGLVFDKGFKYSGPVSKRRG